MKDVIFVVGFLILFLTMTGGMWMYLENPFGPASKKRGRRRKPRSIELPRGADTHPGATPVRISSGIGR